MGEAIVVTSGKGGVGKTTTTANIGLMLAHMGKRVALIDADLGLRNLDVVLGLENRIVYDITHVASMETELRFALVKDKRYPNLVLLPASQAKHKEDLSPKDVELIIADLKKDYDYILVDCPAGVDRGFRNATCGVDSAIVVTTPEIPAVRDADRAIGMLEDMNIKSRVVINRIRPRMIKNGGMLPIDEIMGILSAELLGVIPDDDDIIASTNKAEPSVIGRPNSAGGIAYSNITRRILGENVPFMRVKSESMLSRILLAIRG